MFYIILKAEFHFFTIQAVFTNAYT